MIAPAAMRVINARCSPDRRNAGSPIRTPIAAVMSPVARRSTGNGSDVRVGEARADPRADREQADLAERDHPDPAVEDPEARATTA